MISLRGYFLNQPFYLKFLKLLIGLFDYSFLQVSTVVRVWVKLYANASLFRLNDCLSDMS